VNPKHVGKLDVTEKPPGSSPPWWVQCWACPGGRWYSDALKEIVGVPASLIFQDPEQHLAPWLTGRSRTNGSYGPPPSEGNVQGWRSALMEAGNASARRYLQETRGLLLGTIVELELGYDRDRHAITIPIRDEAGELVNVKRRVIRRGATKAKRGLSRPAALYPIQTFAEDPTAIVLCEGELDALLLKQSGLPAVTSTSGTNGWDKYPAWHEHFVGRSVAVVYDCGAESYAKATVRAQALQEAGALDAWPVDLGLAQGEDVTNWFVKYGRDAHALRELLNKERRRKRGRA
jgi:hypothetical protein